MGGGSPSKRKPPKTIALNFIKKMNRSKGKIGKFTLIVGDLKISLAQVHRIIIKCKFTKDRVGLKKKNPLDLPDLYAALYQKRQNSHFFQVLLEHLPKLTICWVIKQVITKLKGLKLFNAYSLTILAVKSVTGKYLGNS